MFERLDVNGVAEHPLFTFLKSLCPSPINEFHLYPNITYVPVRSNDIRWNFEKVSSLQNIKSSSIDYWWRLVSDWFDGSTSETIQFGCHSWSVGFSYRSDHADINTSISFSIVRRVWSRLPKNFWNINQSFSLSLSLWSTNKHFPPATVVRWTLSRYVWGLLDQWRRSLWSLNLSWFSADEAQPSHVVRCQSKPAVGITYPVL